MRQHYESLNYWHKQPGHSAFRFTRTQGSTTGYLVTAAPTGTGRAPIETTLTRQDVEGLRDMIAEVLEDWK